VAGLVNRKPRRCTSPIGPFDRAARTLCNTRVPPSSGMSQNAQRWYGTRSPTGFESHRMEDRPFRPPWPRVGVLASGALRETSVQGNRGCSWSGTWPL
jgi:hypothetical protein